VARADLIEPTRGLSEDNQSQAELWVFSEPPGQKVVVNGSVVGMTPVILRAVSAAVHSLQVGGSETSVVVEPGKTTQIVLFKGEFIRVPESHRRSRQQGATQPDPGKGTRPAQPASDRTEAETRRGLSDWELYMNRTLPFF
jgi:hypothetical protein